MPSQHVIIEILLRPGIQGRARKCLMFVSKIMIMIEIYCKMISKKCRTSWKRYIIYIT